MRAAVAVAAVVVAVGLWGFWPDTAPTDLGVARAWADDDDAWVTALQAGQTSAEVSELLVSESERCGAEEDEEDDAATAVRCERMLETAAWARVSSVALLRCTRPGVFAFRADLRRALDALIEGDGLDQPPPIPGCD